MKRSKLYLPHERKLTMKANGTLYPIFCEAVVPGDKFKITSEILARMTPLINPIYHRFDIVTHYFFVPNRLVWKNFENFIFPEPKPEADSYTNLPMVTVIPGDATAEPQPGKFVSGLMEEGSLADHLGCGLTSTVPLSGETVQTLQILPFRAYHLICNEWYRDQDLQKPVAIQEDLDGWDPTIISDPVVDKFDLLRLRKRCWEKDYFTSARPWPMKGGDTTEARVYTQRNTDAAAASMTPATGNLSDGGTGVVVDDNRFIKIVSRDGTAPAGEQPISFPDGGFTLNELRYANAVTKYLEKLQRTGSRYVEAIKAFFHVQVPDFRIDRPEYIGGGRQPFVISEVLQTAQDVSEGGTPLGTYGGHGISSGQAQANFFVPEFGYIIGLCSIMPRAGYMHAIRKDFLKTNRFDFYFPEFANLGEQEVKFAELFGGARLDDEIVTETFGYQERYAEYKFIPSTTHGLFRTDANLRNFHADRAGVSYELDSDFVQIMNSDDVERIFALDAVNYDPFLVSVLNRVEAVRPMPIRVKPDLF